MKHQVRIPPALCSIHNFIRLHDPTEFEDFHNIQEDPDPVHLTGDLAETIPNAQERARANQRRDYIAEQMWNDYEQYMAQTGDDM